MALVGDGRTNAGVDPFLAAAVKKGVAGTTGTTMGSTTGATGGASTVNPAVTYGSNVTNFDPNNAQHIALADAGQAWWTAKNAGDAAGMKAAEQAGQSIRSGLQGSTFDKRTGLSTLGAPMDGYGAADVENEIAAQLAAYNAQLASARNAADYQVGVNNQYLQDALSGLQSGEAVALDQAQQTQNRFGGLYSGGLPYQSGEINRTYAGQRGSISRDIAGRNQLILDQYGNQANEIAANIAKLQSTSPQVIRDRILDFQLKTAPITGTFQGAPTFDAKQFEYAQGRDKVADSQWKATFDEDKRRYGEEFAYRKARDSITDAEERRQFDIQVQQNGLDRAVQWYNAETNRMGENRLAAGGSSGGETKLSTTERRNQFESDLLSLSKEEGLGAVKEALNGEEEGIVAEFGQSYFDNIYKRYFPDEE